MKLVVLKTIIVKYIAGLALALSVTACASTGNISKNRVIQTEPRNTEMAYLAYKVEKLSVAVPTELTVSEANVLLPMSDIVWREDPLGNRKQQIQTILIDAISKGTAKVETGHAVTMEVRLNKFHALTEKPATQLADATTSTLTICCAMRVQVFRSQRCKTLI